MRRILCIDDIVDMLHVMHDMFGGESVDCASPSGVGVMEVVGRIAERAS